MEKGFHRDILCVICVRDKYAGYFLNFLGKHVVVLGHA